MILLAVWLITTGILPLVKIQIPASGMILALLAIAAGVLILIGGGRIRLSKNLGMLLLCIWLILFGLQSLVNFTFPAFGLILSLLAIAAGIFLLIRR